MSNTDFLDKNLVQHHLATESDHYEIKHFLKKNKQSSVSRDDRVYILRQQKKLIGIARLIPAHDSNIERYWLRGLFIDELWRNKGLASQLLNTIDQDLTSIGALVEIIAFPYQHLDSFYQFNGYHHIEPSLLREPLKTSYFNAKQQQKNWLCMGKLIKGRSD